ncbi:hypothetical protein D3C79_1062710 [compost metagenome]
MVIAPVISDLLIRVQELVPTMTGGTAGEASVMFSTVFGRLFQNGTSIKLANSAAPVKTRNTVMVSK